MLLMLYSLLTVGSLTLGAVLMWLVMRVMRQQSRRNDRTETRLIAEKVRAVGKLIGLEVYAKEIATARRGWGWVPPALLSEARVAMIFQFEKQYGVELGGVTPESVERLGPNQFRLRLPPVRGTLRLLDVRPYDIQQGRLLGLLDVVPMTAERQGELMQQAQYEASGLFSEHDDKYRHQAREAIERQLGALLKLLDVDVELSWMPDRQREDPGWNAEEPKVELGPRLRPAGESKPRRSEAAATAVAGRTDGWTDD